MYEAGEIIDEATRGIPEEILENEKVQEALQYLFDTVSSLTDWIDPQSDGYLQELHYAREDGIFNAREKMLDILEDALYRQKMFGSAVNLEELIDTARKVEVEH